MEGLQTLVDSVPSWHTILEDLNTKMANRQVELAQSDSNYRPAVRSLRNKGSTESLRPKDNETQMPCVNEEGNRIQYEDHQVPTRDGVFTASSDTRPEVSAADQRVRLTHHSSSPGPLPPPVRRQLSQRIANQQSSLPPMSPPAMRKRKTQSMASNGSQAPKYRTRSMIIVYYDSAVQNAFEELVRHISASRNAMRRGKMAARMASMRQMAAMESGDDDEEEEEEEEEKTSLPGISPPPIRALPMASTKAQNGDSSAGVHIDVDNGLGEGLDETELSVANFKFLSTRRMGPSRDSPQAAKDRVKREALPLGSLGPRSGFSLINSADSNMYDNLDSGLEWCQSMCERAAHQFLRDGECFEEVEGIKRRLSEVREIAQGELAKPREVEVVAMPNGIPVLGGNSVDDSPRLHKPAQIHKSAQMRIKLLGSFDKDQESTGLHPGTVDSEAMEVDDDEGFEEPVAWVSSRTRMQRALIS